MIFSDETEHLTTADGQRESTVTPSSVEDHFSKLSVTTAQRFRAMARAVRAGVTKAHQISFATDGGLLQELFTADGAGTQIIEEKRSRSEPPSWTMWAISWRLSARWKRAAHCSDAQGPTRTRN